MTRHTRARCERRDNFKHRARRAGGHYVDKSIALNDIE